MMTIVRNEKFHYCCHIDELEWYVDLVSEQGIRIEKIPAPKIEIAEWIDKNCKDMVIGWNGVYSPSIGQTDWHTALSPQGGMTFFFNNDDDKVLFLLTWQDKQL